MAIYGKEMVGEKKKHKNSSTILKCAREERKLQGHADPDFCDMNRLPPKDSLSVEQLPVGKLKGAIELVAVVVQQ